MIFLRLLWVFSRIGIFNFGGGYAMLSLIQNEVVVKNHWLTNAEFTNIVAISQSTPGPIGINCATYVGYTATLHAGYSHTMAILGAVLASLSIIWLPFILMLLVSSYLMRHKNDRSVTSIFRAMRPTIVGLIAAAAMLLMTEDNFGSWQDNPYYFLLSAGLFLVAFVLSFVRKTNPILLILAGGLVGVVVYGVF